MVMVTHCRNLQSSILMLKPLCSIILFFLKSFMTNFELLYNNFFFVISCSISLILSLACIDLLVLLFSKKPLLFLHS